MRSYFDTSALTKILLNEIDAPVAADLWRASIAVATSRVTYAEARASLGAAARAGRVDGDGLERSRARLENLWRRLYVIDVTDLTVRMAGDLAERHALRGFDALHLATSLALGAGSTFVTWDRRLADAARDRGLAVGGIRA